MRWIFFDDARIEFFYLYATSTQILVGKTVLELVEKGESDVLEFKESFDRECIETAGAFANAKGGTILIGVSDDGRVKGVSTGKESLSEWANVISQDTEPKIIPEIEAVDAEGKKVVLIHVKEFPIKPVAVKGRCFRRVGNSNRVMAPQEIAEIHLHSIGSSWDAFPARDVDVGALDLKKVENYVRMANATSRRKIENEKPLEVLKKLKLIRDGKRHGLPFCYLGKSRQRLCCCRQFIVEDLGLTKLR